MKQFIAPQVLRVNGAPSPCECGEGVVCPYCVQANLLLWERSERAGEERMHKLCREIKDYGVRRLAKNLDIPHTTVATWLKSGRINPLYLPSVAGVVEGGG